MTLQSSTPISAELPFDPLNADGSLATWIEPVSKSENRTAFLYFAGVGVGLAGLVLFIAFATGGGFSLAWGLVPLGVCWFVASQYGKATEVRRYAEHSVKLSQKQRLIAAMPWWTVGVWYFGAMWYFPANIVETAATWWHMLMLATFLALGWGFYFVGERKVLTPNAAKAKAYYEAGEQIPSKVSIEPPQRTEPAEPTEFDRFLESAVFRYPLSVVVLVGAYYFAVESTYKHAAWVAAFAVMFAGFLAHEVAKWSLGLVLVGLFIWAVVAGITALPVSAAIIVGALIIAAAIKR
jgi:hypothetical protein